MVDPHRYIAAGSEDGFIDVEAIVGGFVYLIQGDGDQRGQVTMTHEQARDLATALLVRLPQTGAAS